MQRVDASRALVALFPVITSISSCTPSPSLHPLYTFIPFASILLLTDIEV